MYETVLLVHGWVRWPVLALGVAFLLRAARAWGRGRVWTDRDERWRRVFLWTLYAQVALGLALYTVLSPIPRAGLADLQTTLGDGVLRFFAIEHPFGMLGGVLVAHFGLRGARTASGPRAARRATLTLVVWLLLTAGSVPWPGLAYGRPLLRPW